MNDIYSAPTAARVETADPVAGPSLERAGAGDHRVDIGTNPPAA